MLILSPSPARDAKGKAVAARRLLIQAALSFVTIGFFSTASHLLARSTDSLKVLGEPSEFPPYENMLPNGGMEEDKDLNNVPDGWTMYSWVPSESGPLREAVIRYLDLEVPEIGVSLEGRRTFLGERSVRLFTTTGKIGPGIWTTVDLSPGIYTLNLAARSIGSGSRVLATFLAQEGRLTQIDEKWRWIAHTESLPYATPGAPIVVNDWTFEEGGILLDQVSLVKLPFDVRYERRLELSAGDNPYTIEIATIPGAVLPIGANLEVHEPSGTIVRKNMELEAREGGSQFTFTLHAESAGEYSATVELYNPRTTSILYKDDGVRAYLSGGAGERAGSTRRGSFPEGFFPVGMSVRGYELDAFEGKSMNTILLKDPDPLDIAEVLEMAGRMKLSVIAEIDASDSLHLNEKERALVEKASGSSSLLGFSLLSGWGQGKEKQAFLASAAHEVRELAPSVPLFLRNYLPGPLDARVLEAVDVLFVDPFPISVPAKPLYTISNWIEKACGTDTAGMRKVAIVQAFAGWPYAKRAPTFDEVRALVRLSLAHGIDGIILHTFSGDFPYFDDPLSSNWDMRRLPELWNRIGELARETADFQRRFGKPGKTHIPIRFLPEGALDVATFSDDTSLYIQVVNLLPSPVGIRGVSPLFHEADTIRTFSEGGALACEEGFFEDTLPHYGVRVYSLGRLVP